jgi:hypothetical protein
MCTGKLKTKFIRSTLYCIQVTKIREPLIITQEWLDRF